MLNSLLYKAGHLCGLTVPLERRISSRQLIDDHIKNTTRGAVSLADYLNYQQFDQALDLFYNEDNYVGFMLEIAPIVGSNNDIEKNLNLFFNSELPDDSYLQFLLMAGHNIDDKLELWKEGRGKFNHEMLTQLTEYREAFLRDKASDFANCDGRMGRDFKIYVCYSKLAEGKEILSVKKFQRKLMQKFVSLKLSPRVCDASDLISVAGDIAQMELNSSRNRRRKSTIKYDLINSLNTQILKPLRRVEITEESIIHHDEGLVSKCLYPKVLPEEFSLMEMIGLLGSEKEGLSIPARFIISYSLANDLGKSGQAQVLSKGTRAIHAAEQWYTRHDTNLKKEAAEWREIIARHKNGEQFLTENMQVMITSSAEEIEIAEENLKSLYNSIDWQLEVNRNLQLPAMLSILPMQQAYATSHSSISSI